MLSSIIYLYAIRQILSKLLISRAQLISFSSPDFSTGNMVFKNMGGSVNKFKIFSICLFHRKNHQIT